MQKTPITRTADDPTALAIRPSGVEIYTDLERGKRFIKLFYRKRDAGQGAALAFIADVIADLTAAGVTISGDVRPTISLKKGADAPQTVRTPCTCALELTVRPQGDEEGWVESIRRRFGKPDPNTGKEG